MRSIVYHKVEPSETCISSISQEIVCHQADKIYAHLQCDTAKTLKQMMSHWRYDLENLGIYFDNYRNNSTRFMKIRYVSSAGDGRVDSDV